MIYESLRQIQKALKAPKNQRNNFGNYDYRSAEDILEALKPLMIETTLTLNDDIVMIGARYYVKSTATLRQKEETVIATAYAREEETKKGMDGSQITGAASSYARKYALNALFLIDDTKDSDHTNTDETKTVATPATKTAPDTMINEIIGTLISMEVKKGTSKSTGKPWTAAKYKITHDGETDLNIGSFTVIEAAQGDTLKFSGISEGKYGMEAKTVVKIAKEECIEIPF